MTFDDSRMRYAIEGCAIATVDGSGTEHDSGYILVLDNVIADMGAGAVPDHHRAHVNEILDGRGLLATPGLVNCHHHLYQWLTRGLAQEANLFEWLGSLYPVWRHIDDAMETAAARAGLLALALSGCSTTTDHHYVFPRGTGDLLQAEVEAARNVALRFHPTRGSMDLGVSRGGLPPDEITEDRDEILSATEKAIDAYHDDSFDSMLRIAVAPCSPFSVTRELMRESADLARSRGVRLHTHLAETKEEEEFCKESFGMRPLEYLEEVGWLGDDVWLAHCVHLSQDEVHKLGVAGMGVAHCPSSNARLGAGIAPVADLLDAGAAVGIGVDGAASNESGSISVELREALLYARARGGARALTARRALEMATMHGARCLGRADEIGSLEPGKLADLALWRLDDLDHAGIDDPVAAVVLGRPPRVEWLFVDGEPVVRESVPVTVDESEAARDLEDASRILLEKAGSA